MAERLNQAERNLLKYLQGVNDGSGDTLLRYFQGLNDAPTDTALVAAFQARELDEDVRTRAISSLRWACDGDDYDFIRAAGDLGGAEIDLWNTVL